VAVADFVGVVVVPVVDFFEELVKEIVMIRTTM
jgi:hypothetical protein